MHISKTDFHDLKAKTAIPALLKIISKLKKTYPPKEFTIDGRLLGDLGETFAAEIYDIELYKGIQKYYDGETSDGKMVQIKTTMKNSLTFPCKHVPDYYLGVRFDEYGEFEEIYNGPGKFIKNILENRKDTSNGLHSISLSTLRKMNQMVLKDDKILLKRM